ncbi:hypothetical protein NR798_25995 [Archangium gephyra]|uniref:hypothetical protein n=1 Tax=Archangium gephyra TaxID=48 RepID=UPI0035D3F7BB
MDTHFTVDELLALVHRFYPSNLEGNDPRHETSEEFQRLLAAREAAMADTPRAQAWDSFFRRLRDAVPGSHVENWSTLRYDACWRCRVYLPGTSPTSTEVKAVVGLVSILAPVFAIYASHQTYEGQRVSNTRLFFPPMPTEFHEQEAILDGLIRSSFGFERLPNEILFTPVSDLQVGNKAPEKVQLIDCLFTDNRW